MAFSAGVQVACGYVQGHVGVPLFVLITNSVSSADAVGVTNFVAPSAFPTVSLGAASRAFEVSVAADTFVAIGPAPDAVNGPRILVRAGTDRLLFCRSDDKIAWAAA